LLTDLSIPESRDIFLQKVLKIMENIGFLSITGRVKGFERRAFGLLYY
jgi:hypothetical protein